MINTNLVPRKKFILVSRKTSSERLQQILWAKWIQVFEHTTCQIQESHYIVTYNIWRKRGMPLDD